MADKKKPPFVIDDYEELDENEEYLGPADVEMVVLSSEEEGEPVVYVKFTNFNDFEEAEDYAESLQKNLPLLLLETTVKH